MFLVFHSGTHLCLANFSVHLSIEISALTILVGQEGLLLQILVPLGLHPLLLELVHFYM